MTTTNQTINNGIARQQEEAQQLTTPTTTPAKTTKATFQYRFDAPVKPPLSSHHHHHHQQQQQQHLLEGSSDDIVHAIERSTNDKSSRAVEMGFFLLDQLTLACQHNRSNHSNYSKNNNNNNNNNEDDHDNHLHIPPDILNRVINAWRVCWKEGDTAALKSLTPYSVFLKLCERQSLLHLPPALQPDLLSYNMIIDATKKSNDSSNVNNNKNNNNNNNNNTNHNINYSPENDMPALAETILDHLIKSSETNEKLLPDLTTCNSVIDAWAQSSRPNAPRQAENLLNKMQQWSIGESSSISSSSSDDNRRNIPLLPQVQPDVVSYNCVIAAWANCRHHRRLASRRARELLLEMQQVGRLVPDRFSYMAVLAALTRSQQNDDVDRALDLVHQMFHRYEHDGDVELKPNAQCYTAIVMACVSCGRLDRAGDIIKEQLEMYDHTGTLVHRDILPEPVAFEALIHAWCKKVDTIVESPLMAESILHNMRDLSISLEEPSLMPSTTLFNVVLNAWTQASSNNHHHDQSVSAPQRCEDLLQMMHELEKAGYALCKPNVDSYSTVIKCWEKSTTTPSATSKDKNLAAERADAIFRYMVLQYEAGDNSFKPSKAMYNTIIGIWSKSDLVDAPERGQALFDELRHKSEAGGDTDDGVGNKHHDRWELDATTAGTLMRLWGQSKRGDGAVKAQAIFDDLMVLYRTTGDPLIKPTLFEYNTLLDAWAKAGEVERAEEILRAMETSDLSGVTPDHSSYNTVLNAWARSASRRDAPERARAIYDRMTRRYQAGFLEVKPNKFTFVTLITLWSRSGREEGAAKAQALFDDMLARYKNAGEKDCKPNDIAVASLINAWAQIGNAGEAERVLRQTEANEFDGVKPTLSCYNCVINSWARSSHPHAPQRAQAIFDSMVERYKSGDVDLKPDKHTVATLLTAWGRQQNQEGATRAQALFDEMLVAYTSGDDEMKPNTVLCNALMEAWGKARDAEQAELIFRQMDAGSLEGVTPDLRSYNSVMTAWSNSGHPNAVERTTAIYDELVQKYESGQSDLRPNLYIYSSLMGAWGRSGQRGAADKIQAIFDELVARYKGGESDLKPDHPNCIFVIHAWSAVEEAENAERVLEKMTDELQVRPNFSAYVKVFNTWYRSHDPNAAERAQRIYEKMIRQYKAGDREVKPNAYIYGCLIKLWGERATMDGALKAQAVFDEQFRRYKDGDLELRPSIIAYSNLLNAWSRVGEAERAEAILKEMYRRPKDCPHPNTQSFNIVIAAWARSNHIVKYAPMRAEKLLRTLQSLGKQEQDCRPNTVSYNTTIRAWTCSSHQDQLPRVESLVQEMIAEAFSGGNREVSPDSYTCQMYLEAITRSSLSNKDERVSQLMEFMRAHDIQANKRFQALSSKFWRNGNQHLRSDELGHCGSRPPPNVNLPTKLI